ncbi:MULTISPECIES: long-chain-fatty-acid--CoA ligase [Chryseobacterium]|uniref:Long-chain acyl-CoA synthetase n=1 Tax=Chryseobacterium camelliae TaxID=1265445 RepID=A0ABU0TJ81_9FLAO|nr:MULTISPECIES: long-chain fatty acid--CoA ligase [Chryseobacterium]MDT3409267.1 long-chain acyl-CoA synthetase [Pseudacidovorax intermedius]MDQ1096871.1 long-chain acyl-CoA synthetase [Chryseobacterium camelliae]MDQ1100812.1 long-chain acyl-CoA synthetase [Chryseobacterium sp. SORGH_AS_1048]MDR6084254.1 long-chain acyl-CoA synthetase [Chryseobacterium sp. SORGH_AS_0909]MDR6132527.1 long-chain acyl-CoA synthetase [Chryseobacterium sp. SORGH_AS_1175]
MLNLSFLVEQSAKRNPERHALSSGVTTLTYEVFHKKICQVAHALAKKGIGHGDKVALLCPNIPQFAVIFFGILKTGASVVPLSILMKADEISYHLSDSESILFFCFAGTPELPTGQFGKEGFDKTESCKHFIGIGPVSGDILSLDDFMKDEEESFECRMTSAEDTAVILYTSGTTGKPKGAELSHINLFSNAETCTGVVGSKEFEAQLVVLPLFHIFGLTVMMLAGIRKSLHLILLPKFEAKTVYQLIRTFNIRIFAGVPSMYWSLLNEEDSEENRNTIKGLRICISGGASLPGKIIDEFKGRFGVPIIEGYGMSEGSPVVTFNQLEVGVKAGSIGTPIWGVDVRIVDDEGNELPEGEKGELIFRGPNVMKSYYRRPEETAEVLKDGWLFSGDIAVKDHDGFFFIVDRKKELIIRGGMNVYPREVEELMIKHPDISLVAVVGHPDEKLGEEIKAFVVKKPGSTASESDIIAWTKQRIAAYKYPRIIEFIEELPLSATGKILKKLLKT